MKTLFIILSLFFTTGGTYLNFNKPAEIYLQSLRVKYKTALQKENVDFDPILLKDSSYVLNTSFLTDPNFTIIVNALDSTTFKDSLIQKTINDTLFIVPASTF